MGFSTTGIDRLVARYEAQQRLIRQPHVEVYFRPSTATVTRQGYASRGRPRKGKARTSVSTRVDRTAGQNTVIANTHRKRGRNPWHLSAAEQKAILDRIRPHLAAFAGKSDPQAIDRALQVAGREIVTRYRAHVDQGKSARGSMRPLAKGYAESKRKQVGDKPILVYSGALLGGLAFRIKR